MTMKKILAFFWILTIMVLLSACKGQDKQPLELPSSTPKPSATLTPTQVVARPTWTPVSTQTSTATSFPPYPTKQVLLDYTFGGSHAPDDLYYLHYGYSQTKLVLYTDGQLVIPGKTFQQKILSTFEVNQLFLQLEAKGLFSLTQDNLYNFGYQNSPKTIDGMMYCIVINGKGKRNLCASKTYESFLVPKMKNILQFFNEYQPKGMTPYYPDRILLWVHRGRSPSVQNLPAKAIPWPEKFSSLETSGEKVMYFQGEAAKEIFALFGNSVSAMVINQNGIEYTVLIDIVFPHEQL
jgi:hypothetical protein